jgi:hypothetical protein
MSSVIDSARVLYDCLCTELATSPNPPVHCQFRVGLDPVAADFDQFEDYCCSGLAYLRIIRIYPSGDNFPARDEVSIPCQPLAWGIEMEMGVFRCLPAEPQHMDPVAWQDAFDQVQRDAEAMRHAACCWIEHQESNNVAWLNSFFRDWFPFSNQGGCGGGAISITAQIQM